MTRPNDNELKRLRAAFSAASERTETDLDPDRIWSAIRGELPPDEVADLADRASQSPETAQAWRIALEMSRRFDEAGGANVTPIDRRRPVLRALGLVSAAIVVIGVGAMLHRSFAPEPAPVYRAVDELEIASELPPDVAIPRGNFVLRWTAVEEGAIYEIVLTDTALSVLDRAAFLERNEYRVPEATLAGLEKGTEVWWTVEATRSDGSRITSPTFVTPVK